MLCSHLGYDSFIYRLWRAGPIYWSGQIGSEESMSLEQVIKLMSDVPRNNPKAGAYLLASLVGHLPKDCIVFAVVDPGAGGDVGKVP